MMQIIHSVWRETEVSHPSKQLNSIHQSSELMVRYKAYETACKKYQHEIDAIQKYIPGWVPAFNR